MPLAFHVGYGVHGTFFYSAATVNVGFVNITGYCTRAIAFVTLSSVGYTNVPYHLPGLQGHSRHFTASIVVNYSSFQQVKKICPDPGESIP